MEVLRITGKGITTSFRYPHFIQGVHPTFEMPPPSTIYGHICSALGEWFDPQGVWFAYCFRFDAKFFDVEHLHIVREVKSRSKVKGTDYPLATEGNINPWKREILFNPTLTLYINKPEWYEKFHSPKYPVALGRSQDLFTYTDVEVIKLIESDQAYFENTLLPYEMGLRVGAGYAVLMPRYLDYERGRAPVFERYYVLRRRVFSSDLIKIRGNDDAFWVDPFSEEVKGSKLGLAFHSFVDDDGGTTMAGTS